MEIAPWIDILLMQWWIKGNFHLHHQYCVVPKMSFISYLDGLFPGNLTMAHLSYMMLHYLSSMANHEALWALLLGRGHPGEIMFTSLSISTIHTLIRDLTGAPAIP